MTITATTAACTLVTADLRENTFKQTPPFGFFLFHLHTHTIYNFLYVWWRFVSVEFAVG